MWIGLIASIFIFVEAFTGLLLNEPWLIGQSAPSSFVGGQGFGARGNFQPKQFNQRGNNQRQNSYGDSSNDSNGNGQMQGQNGFRGNGQVQGRGGFAGRQLGNQSSFFRFISGLHDGRIGSTNIKWLMDLAALAAMFLTGSGVYLSIKTLRDKKRKDQKNE